MPIIIMYHHVNDSGMKNAFPTARFREQLARLQKTHSFATLTEWMTNGAPDNCCILTFDDGLRDGYVEALPIMEEFGARGVFLIPTRILVERKVIAAQKRGMVLSAIGVDAFLEQYNAIVPSYYRITEGRALDAYNDPKTSLLKYILDHIEVDLSERVVGEIFSRYFDEGAAFDDLYLSEEMMRDLRNRGHDVGTHGHAHRWLGKLYPADQKDDLKQSIEVFQERFGEHPRLMSYPFGSYNLITVRLAEYLGFQAAMLDPTSAVTGGSAFELNRYDCIDVSDQGLPQVTDRVTAIH